MSLPGSVGVALLAGLLSLAGQACVDSTQSSGARSDRNGTRTDIAPRDLGAGDSNSTPRDMPGAGRGSRDSSKGK